VLAVVDVVVGAVEVVDGAVVEVLAPVAVLEWLTVDVGGVVGDPPQETRPRVKPASAAIAALGRIIPPLYQVRWRSLSEPPSSSVGQGSSHRRLSAGLAFRSCRCEDVRSSWLCT
jgi:hypothetical protein